MSIRYLLILITLVLYITKSQAQKDNHNKIANVSVQATIIDQISRQVIMGAKVTIKEIGLETYTDQQGHFAFTSIPLRKFTMTIEHDNYITKELDILDYNSKKVLRYSLVPNSLKMDEVVVIGKKSNQNSSTSTLINRKAIEH